MSSTTINIRTKSEIKRTAQEIAEELGFNLSTLVNAFLRQFIRTRTIFFSLGQENHSPFLMEQLEKSEEERKTGQFHSFNKKKDVLTFIDELIK